MTLREYLEAYMKEHDLGIREFSRNCKLSHTVILNILEKPDYRPEITTLEKISNYTGSKLVSLLKMSYPDAFKDDDLDVTSELVAQAFETASEGIQEAVLKLVGLK